MKPDQVMVSARKIAEAYEGPVHLVPPGGKIGAPIVFVGLTSTHDTAKPFDGEPTRGLREKLLQLGVRPDEVYFTHLLKCPGRAQHLDYVLKSRQLLAAEIRMVRPRAVVVAGGPAAALMFPAAHARINSNDTEEWRQFRFGVRSLQVNLFVTYAPEQVFCADGEELATLQQNWDLDLKSILNTDPDWFMFVDHADLEVAHAA